MIYNVTADNAPTTAPALYCIAYITLATQLSPLPVLASTSCTLYTLKLTGLNQQGATHTQNKNIMSTIYNTSETNPLIDYCQIQYSFPGATSKELVISVIQSIRDII